MQSNRSKDTSPERLLRSALHRRGLRFRLPLLSHGRGKADVVFTRARVAVFVDGCFWHGCPDHGTMPKTNAEFWSLKIESNKRRDREVDEALAATGWSVVRAWAHEPTEAIAELVAQTVRGAAVPRRSDGQESRC